MHKCWPTPPTQIAFRLPTDSIRRVKAAGLTRGRMAWLNGRKVDGNPAMIRLAAHQELAIVYGPRNAKVKVPDKYTFDKGL